MSGLFGQLERALDGAAKDVSKAVDGVAHNSPVDALKPGNIVCLRSKLAGKCLRTVENGALDCGGDQGTACEYQICTGSMLNTIRFRNVGQPNFYIAVSNNFVIGYGQGGQDCDFIASIALDNHVVLESALAPGSHIGVLPTGQLTSPAQTSKSTDASHFHVRFMRKGTI